MQSEVGVTARQTKKQSLQSAPQVVQDSIVGKDRKSRHKSVKGNPLKDDFKADWASISKNYQKLLILNQGFYPSTASVLYNEQILVQAAKLVFQNRNESFEKFKTRLRLLREGNRQQQ